MGGDQKWREEVTRPGNKWHDSTSVQHLCPSTIWQTSGMHACKRECEYWFNVCLALSDRWHWMWLMSILQHCEIWNMRTTHIFGLFLLHLSFNPRNIQITCLTNIYNHFVSLPHSLSQSECNFHSANSHLVGRSDWGLQVLKDVGESHVLAYLTRTAQHCFTMPGT